MSCSWSVSRDCGFGGLPTLRLRSLWSSSSLGYRGTAQPHCGCPWCLCIRYFLCSCSLRILVRTHGLVLFLLRRQDVFKCCHKTGLRGKQKGEKLNVIDSQSNRDVYLCRRGNCRHIFGIGSPDSCTKQRTAKSFPEVKMNGPEIYAKSVQMIR